MLNKSSNPITIQLGGQSFILDASGCLYWPSEKTLIVADLHFEKGSFLAKLGNPIPVLDTMDTLSRLTTLIKFYQPARVICLGDNIHDQNAFSRMREVDSARLEIILQQVNEWVWLIGNHDKTAISFSHSVSQPSYQIHNIVFTHDHNPQWEYQIMGHFHPKISVKTVAGKITDKCFVVNANVVIMPAFGTFTGGLDVKHAAFEPVLAFAESQYYLIYKEKIWRVK